MSSEPPDGADTTGSGDEDRTHDDPAGEARLPLRELVIRAGLDVLERDGLCLSAQSLSYARVFDHLEREHGIKITRASVHERIWANHAEFRREVLAETIDHMPTSVLGGRGPELQAFVADLYAQGLDTDDRSAEFARRFAPLGFEVVRRMPSVRDAQVTKAMATPFNDPDTAEVVQGSIRARARAVLSGVLKRFSDVTAGLGLWPNPALGLDSAATHEMAAVIASNLVAGLFLDVHAGYEEATRALSLRGLPSTADEPWTMLGIATVACLNALFEGSEQGGPLVPIPPRPGAAVAPEVDGGDSSRRRRRSELRELVLAAGVELVLREPLNLRPESLSYASVFAYIEEKHGIKVYRSSVHKRIWDTHDDYWLEVLTRGIYSDPNVSQAAVARLMDYSPATRPDGSVHRRQVAMDIVRVVTGAETEHSLRSIDYLRRQSIKAALMTAPASEPMSSLRQVIRRTQQERLAHHVEAVRANVVSLGFEVRPEMGIDEDEALRIVVSLALTAASGAVFDTSAGVETATKTFAVRRVDDPGRTDEWLASSMLTWACFDYLFRELP